jgi:hypothetical protein
MPTRGLTSGELQILDFVFSDTVDFERHEITTNDKNIGGAEASIVADFWAVSFSRPALHCLKPKSPRDSDYWYLMMQVQNAEKPPSL